MKKALVTERRLRAIIREELAAAPTGGGGLGKLLDDVAAQFAAKMRASFPGADEAIQKEAQNLKTQLVAQIKAAAAQVKLSASKPS